MLGFGVPAFALHAMPQAEWDDRLQFFRLIPVAAIVGLALSAADIAVVAANMAGLPLTALDWDSVSTVITETAAGTAWLVRVGALLAVIAFAGLTRDRRWLCPASAVCCAAALATLAWSGHGAANDGRVGVMHLLADVVHLLAAGLWIGALAGLLLMLRRVQPSDCASLDGAHRELAGFATTGTVIVAVIAATGLINAWLLVGPGQFATVAGSLYGQLLLSKLALFTGMLGLAAVNRFWLTPALAADAFNGKSALRGLRSSLIREVALAIGILGLVAWLGTLEPPMAAI